VVDFGGTPFDLSDDVFLSERLIFGSTGTNDTEGRDFCEDFLANRLTRDVSPGRTPGAAGAGPPRDGASTSGPPLRSAPAGTRATAPRAHWEPGGPGAARPPDPGESAWGGRIGRTWRIMPGR
jgi:hypothetical protein